MRYDKEEQRPEKEAEVGEGTNKRRTRRMRNGRWGDVAVDSRVRASSSADQTPLADISRESPNYYVPGKHLMPAPHNISHAEGKHGHETHSLAFFFYPPPFLPQDTHSLLKIPSTESLPHDPSVILPLQYSLHHIFLEPYTLTP